MQTKSKPTEMKLNEDSGREGRKLFYRQDLSKSRRGLNAYA